MFAQHCKNFFISDLNAPGNLWAISSTVFPKRVCWARFVCVWRRVQADSPVQPPHKFEQALLRPLKDHHQPGFQMEQNQVLQNLNAKNAEAIDFYMKSR